ncbi:MAG: 4-alpha-glucanotransferase, partial [bacterium]|nr:4-alpha-glucanotransferase [bacterium]
PSEVEQYMKETGVAGMMALTLAYNLDGENLPAPSRKALNLNNYRGRQVIFTSTHDTVTLLTWLKSLPGKIKNKFLQINDFSPDLTDEKLAQKIIERLSNNKAALIIIPWQDWQGEEFRFNVPGREDLANWQKQISIKKYL